MGWRSDLLEGPVKVQTSQEPNVDVERGIQSRIGLMTNHVVFMLLFRHSRISCQYYTMHI